MHGLCTRHLKTTQLISYASGKKGLFDYLNFGDIRIS